MEELLASQSAKFTTLYRGQEVEGEIVARSDKEIILDLGTKSEGVIATREIPQAQFEKLKIGSKLKAFVSMPENENGQVVLSYVRQAPLKHSRGGKSVDWSKFSTALNQKNKLQGKVLEVNKGGLMVEVAGVRGFLPNSQVGFELLSRAGEGLESLVGENLVVTVAEVSHENNKLIFSQRGQVTDETLEKMKKFKNGQKVKGKIVAILPFGLVVDVAGVEGLVFIADVSWERQEDLSSKFDVGEEIEVLVIGLDEELGRLNLSIKQLTEDPFAKLSEKFPADEVVKGEVTVVTDAGVTVKLAEGIEGFLPAAKMEAGADYKAGKVATLLVDNVDIGKRRINLVPMIISTKDLIYK